jgi:hypothetical protein
MEGYNMSNDSNLPVFNVKLPNGETKVAFDALYLKRFLDSFEAISDRIKHLRKRSAKK